MARRSTKMKDKSNAAYVKRALRNPARESGVVRTTVSVSGSFNAVVASSGGTLKYSDLTGTTDFTNFAALYRTYRIVGIEFQIFDQNPTAVVSALAGTLHTGGVAPSATLVLVQDCPDSANIKPYGQHHYYWRPTNQAERLFMDTSSTSDYGGLYFWSLGGTAVTGKWRYLVRYVVEFKDRI